MIKYYYTQVLRYRKTFANGSSADIELSKTQLFRIGQTRRFLGRLLGPLLENGLPLMKNVFTPLGENVLIPLVLTAVASATDAAFQHTNFWIMDDYTNNCK